MQPIRVPLEDVIGLNRLLPPSVHTCSLWMSDDTGGLFPAELALVAAAVPKRVREFTHGRRIARALLATLDVPGAAILRDRNRAPIWPPGVRGSISHGRSLCAVAVTRDSMVLGLGIDVEEERSETAIESMIATAREREWIARQRLDAPTADPVMLVFSIKEAIYKAIYPSVRRFVDFSEVSVSIDLLGRTFEVGWSEPLATEIGNARLRGTFALEGKIIVSAALLLSP